MNELLASINWLSRHTWRALRSFVRMLLQTESPLIVTIALTLSAAWFSPMVTERFERQKMQSEYVLSNLRELNALIADLYVKVTDINYAVANGKRAPKADIDGARGTIAKLNWKLIETQAILGGRDTKTLPEFQKSVRGVSQALDGRLDLAGCQQLLKKVNAMAFDGALVIQSVGRHVSLSADA